MNDQDNMNEEMPEVSGCPAIGPKVVLPSGFDGVESAKDEGRSANNGTDNSTVGTSHLALGTITDYEDVIADLFQKCNEAFIHAPQQREARPMYFKTVVGDIADALASVVPCDNRGRYVPVASDKDGASADDATMTSSQHEKEVVYRTPQHIVDFIFETCNVPFADQADPAFLKKIAEKFHLSPNKSAADYWKVAEGVQLTRYKGTNVTRLIAVRKGKESNPDVIFEISINATTNKATIKRDDTVLFTIGTDGLSSRRVQTVAISVLRSYLRENARQHRHGKERIHRRVAERLAARMNAEPTAEELVNA